MSLAEQHGLSELTSDQLPDDDRSMLDPLAVYDRDSIGKEFEQSKTANLVQPHQIQHSERAARIWKDSGSIKKVVCPREGIKEPVGKSYAHSRQFDGACIYTDWTGIIVPAALIAVTAGLMGVFFTYLGH